MAVEVEEGRREEWVVGKKRGFDEVGMDGSSEVGKVTGGAGFENEGENVWVKGHEKGRVHVVED